jgi:hypothetical protein
MQAITLVFFANIVGNNRVFYKLKIDAIPMFNDGVVEQVIVGGFPTMNAISNIVLGSVWTHNIIAFNQTIGGIGEVNAKEIIL